MTSGKTKSNVREWVKQVNGIMEILYEDLDVTDDSLWKHLDNIAETSYEHKIPLYFAGAFVMNSFKANRRVDLMNQAISYKTDSSAEALKVSLVLSYHAAISAEHIVDSKLADFLPSIVFPAHMIELITLNDSLEELDYLIAYVKGSLDGQIGYNSVFIEQEYLSYMYSMFDMDAPTISFPYEWGAHLELFRRCREGKRQGDKRHEFPISVLNEHVRDYQQMTSVEKINLIRQLCEHLDIGPKQVCMEYLFDDDELIHLDDPEPRSVEDDLDLC
jgi:hypothetical protein